MEFPRQVIDFPIMDVPYVIRYFQRVQLYHTYATNAMCKAGIPVLDMYPLTAAWPSGTRDSIHYTDKPMEPAIEVLERFLAEHMLKS